MVHRVGHVLQRRQLDPDGAVLALLGSVWHGVREGQRHVQDVGLLAELGEAQRPGSVLHALDLPLRFAADLQLDSRCLERLDRGHRVPQLFRHGLQALVGCCGRLRRRRAAEHVPQIGPKQQREAHREGHALYPTAIAAYPTGTQQGSSEDLQGGALGTPLAEQNLISAKSQRLPLTYPCTAALAGGPGTLQRTAAGSGLGWRCASWRQRRRGAKRGCKRGQKEAKTFCFSWWLCITRA
eukprot:scaffold256_cov261-Pinguiococcus_pyrenoidosus.AAC.14